MEDYDNFLQKVFERANKPRLEKLREELKVMNSIPENPLPEFQEMYVTVRRGSTANIKKVTYSVPSRLIGSILKAKIFENTIELHDGPNLVHKMPRVLGDRGQIIEYRHIIHSLVRKPAAFQNYRYREEMYPTEIFRTGCDKLISIYGDRKGSLEYLRILKFAAETMESEVEAALSLLLGSADIKLSYEGVALLVNAEKKSVSDIAMGELVPELTSYDDLIKGENENESCPNQPTSAQGPQSLGDEYLLSGSDCQVREGELVLREDLTTPAGGRTGSSEGEKDREFTEAIRDTSSVFHGDPRPKVADTEAPQIVTSFTRWEFCGQSGESTGLWSAR
jgi:hypothetical protein